MEDMYDYYINWIEEAISKKHIKYYEYENFNNIEEIGSGSFGKVYRANWKSSNSFLALKSFCNFNSVTVKEVVNEISMNIIRFFGITRENASGDLKKYSLVMEYAYSGTLREYLKENFDNLTWGNKLDLGLQLANAVLCLHDEGIVHRDLHSKNVLLVNQHTIKVADFGLSKSINEVYNNSTKSDLLGVVPYIDPKKFSLQPYSLNKKSDIYSIGVLLWEISSGQPPFKNLSSYGLIVHLPQGLRETPIPDTPTAYVDLYIKCWDGEPDNRPNINDVVAKLRTLSVNGNFSTIVDELVDFTVKVDIDAFIQNVLNYLNSHNVTSQELYNWLINDQSNSNSIVLLGEFNYYGIETDIDKKYTFELYQKAVDLGNVYGMNGLGYCYRYGCGTDINEEKAFELYEKAAKLEFLAGINNLGNCYESGIGTGINKKKAFELYQKAAKSELPSGINNLGYCYENGIGTRINRRKAFELYKKAANLGNNVAQYNVAWMYENIKNVKDINQAIHWYKKSAEQGDVYAQNELEKLLKNKE
ncbi:uncharacterized protein OCT59_023767 [Rhizophagus irregularis]|uniref:uncharacterized protein n=1 Tax=Rhizophagus irregularis TaxID=588596 RepID=UPI00332B09CD|nr:hypothetical protein OCT59_023767 [Rhizophagus irregularis]